LEETIIVGLGNILLTDEGIGVHIINALRDTNPFHNAQYLDLGTSSYELVNYLSPDVQKLVMIDCLKTNIVKAGNVLKLTVNGLLPASGNKLSLHQMKLIDTLSMISLDHDLPEILILGIVPFDMHSYSINLSPEMEKQFEPIIKKVVKHINDFILIKKS